MSDEKFWGLILGMVFIAMMLACCFDAWLDHRSRKFYYQDRRSSR